MVQRVPALTLFHPWSTYMLRCDRPGHYKSIRAFRDRLANSSRLNIRPGTASMVPELTIATCNGRICERMVPSAQSSIVGDYCSSSRTFQRRLKPGCQMLQSNRNPIIVEEQKPGEQWSRDDSHDRASSAKTNIVITISAHHHKVSEGVPSILPT